MDKNQKNNFQTEESEIVGKEMLTGDVALFKIKGRLDFRPGQFVEVELPHIGNLTLAPCSNPADKEGFDLCVRAVGSTSGAFIKLLPGDKILLRGPYGNGWPVEKFRQSDLVVITGGIGIASVRSILLALESKVHFNKINFFAGFKRSDDIIFQADLKRWSRKFRLRTILEYPDSKHRGEHGLITKLITSGSFTATKTLVLMCGPEPMYPFCVESLERKGIADKQIYVSLERRMECGIGLCQHCSSGKNLVCQDGPVFRYDRIECELNK